MGQKEDLLQELEATLPSLRRYARALCAGGGSGATDDLVQTALERATAKVRAKELQAGESGAARLCAYRALTALAREKTAGTAPKTAAQQPLVVQGLANLPFNERATLLLVALEGFSYEAASSILEVPRAVLLGQLQRARSALSALDLRPFASSDRLRRASAYLRIVK
ncbi:RNA polymerase subunit sigma-70 [Methylocystis heyeri]|uniref:RNA polymerase subunit sigma-70 n=1 Tax=Methylocystis heyeri TaxID=391905 RepID=A0A6B8KF23_9HYPH|nr:RNA polymerase subunit sigma-70 [Methylocystis heyeri]QGM46219.1 RNA polymerase subunit sigma-70 [Methylocystis heyeri]